MYHHNCHFMDLDDVTLGLDNILLLLVDAFCAIILDLSMRNMHSGQHAF